MAPIIPMMNRRVIVNVRIVTCRSCLQKDEFFFKFSRPQPLTRVKCVDDAIDI